MYWTAFKSEYILEHGVREHCRFFDFLKNSGLSELGVRGVPSYFGRSQQGGGARAGGINYAHYITPPPPPPQIFTLSNDPGTDQGSHRKGGKGIQGRSPPPTMRQKPLSSRTCSLSISSWTLRVYRSNLFQTWKKPNYNKLVFSLVKTWFFNFSCMFLNPIDIFQLL